MECVFQFLCSSKNNITKIEKMVGVLFSFGEYLGTVGGFHFHEFPTLERLSIVSEQQLREAGFGYRAKCIVGAIKALYAKPGGGVEWLASLHSLDVHEVLDALYSLPGVEPKKKKKLLPALLFFLLTSIMQFQLIMYGRSLHALHSCG